MTIECPTNDSLDLKSKIQNRKSQKDMMKSIHLRVSIASAIVAVALITLAVVDASAQGRRRPAKRPAVCGNPQVPCKTAINFKAYDLPFQLPENAIIYETDLFYAVILKSVKTNETEECVHVSEEERLEFQKLIPDKKVFASRVSCPEELVFYSNVSQDVNFLAVYAGANQVQAKATLMRVKATGKYPQAYIRRMQVVLEFST